jgi:DNA-binding phage protein
MPNNVDYRLNVHTLDRKARAAGHVRHGELNLRCIGRHAGLNDAILSRAVRAESRPDLGTVIALKQSYGGRLDDWVTVTNDVAKAA